MKTRHKRKTNKTVDGHSASVDPQLKMLEEGVSKLDAAMARVRANPKLNSELEGLSEFVKSSAASNVENYEDQLSELREAVHSRYYAAYDKSYTESVVDKLNFAYEHPTCLVGVLRQLADNHYKIYQVYSTFANNFDKEADAGAALKLVKGFSIDLVETLVNDYKKIEYDQIDEINELSDNNKAKLKLLVKSFKNAGDLTLTLTKIGLDSIISPKILAEQLRSMKDDQVSDEFNNELFSVFARKVEEYKQSHGMAVSATTTAKTESALVSGSMFASQQRRHGMYGHAASASVANDDSHHRHKHSARK